MIAENEIITNLYIGNRYSLNKSHQYGLIVNCTPPGQAPVVDISKTIRVPVDDIPEEDDHLCELIHSLHILQKIHEQLSAGNKVLVHCMAGRQRSCAIVACYLIKYHNMTPVQTVQFIQSKRREAFFGSVNFHKTINSFYTK